MSELDVYWAKEPVKAKQCIVFVEGDHGYAPWVSLAGFIGDRKPVAHLLSKFHKQEVFNGVPDFMEPGWPLYLIDDTLILNINSWHVNMSGDGTSNFWIYFYPVVRDTCAFLANECKVNRLDFLTVTAAHESFPDEVYEQLDNTKIYKHSFSGGEESKTEIFLLTPAWMFPWFFTKAGGEGGITVTGFKPDDDLVDSNAVETFAEYISDEYNFVFDSDSSLGAVKEITEIADAENKANKILQKSTISEFIGSGKGNVNGDGVMFG